MVRHPDPIELDTLDLCDLDLFADGFPHDVFTELRSSAPIWWHSPTPNTPEGEGFWVITTHADVMALLHDPRDVLVGDRPGRVGGGTTLIDMPPGLVTGVMLNMSDPPVHERIRGLVNRSFTPRAIEMLDVWPRDRAARLVNAAVEEGHVDFLVDVAAELPLQTIAELMGVPQADRHQLVEWTSTILDYGDRSLTDINNELITAGLGLRAQEEQAFFSLLFTAGSETTRNSIAAGLLALIEHPDEWQRLRADRSLLPTAVEEILRWTSATAYNRRTVFDDPFRFDVGRSPNPHLAFGHGIHHCLGAALARREITVVFDVLLDRVEQVALAGPIEWGRSNKHTSMRHLPVELTRRKGHI